jgi:RimJ/RimL family protein N-acetyltransferase
VIALRARRHDDAPYAAAWTSDPETTRWLLLPYGRAEWSVPDEPVAFGDVRLTIEADGTPIGTCGLIQASPEHRRAMAFLVIGDAAYRGRGYGTAAMRALIELGFDEMNLAKIELEVLADNTPAIALYERLGFVREVHRRRALWAHGAWRDEYLMGLLR